jgi:acyl-CoA synthetase (AMP-forming)/AMP-acid ligase II
VDTGTALRMTASRSPRGIAILDRDRAVSYGELVSEVDSLASGLGSLRVPGGKLIVLAVANSADAALMLLAIQAAAAAAVPTNFRARIDSLAWILEKTAATALIVDENSAASLRDLHMLPPELLLVQIAGGVGSGQTLVGLRAGRM